MKAAILILGLFALNSVCHGFGNSSGRGLSYLGRSTSKSNGQSPVYNGLGYANGDYQMKQATAAKPLEAKSSRGFGISAWGIILVMTSVVFLCMGVYYFILFYPILCKKERKINQNTRMNCCPTAPPSIDNVDNANTLSTPV